jgi:hypothetical protein
MRLRVLPLCGFAAALLVLHPHATRAQQDTSSAGSHVLPFSAQEDRDGARFVWFIYGRGPYRYEYVPVDSFPRPSEFTQVEPEMVQAGDVVRWPQWMGIADGEGEGSVVGGGARRSIRDLTRTFGAEPKYFRRLRPPSKH